jgi:sugar phosphate isomerase/epimerase
MRITRRRVLQGAAATAWPGAAQQRSAGAPKTRSAPAICLYSRVLSKIDYTDLPMVLRGLGFDGCDLSVQPGGHVPPGQADTILMPALEALTGAGLEPALISTALTSGTDEAAGTILGLAGLIGVPLFRPGNWNFAGAGPRLLRQVASLATAGRANNMAIAIPVTVEPGGRIDEIEAIIRALDPVWVGYDFDPAAAWAQGGPDALAAAFRQVRPRLKMITARDLSPGAMAPCPVGQGIVDWRRVFELLSAARFTGPVSLTVEYRPEDELAAIRRDLAVLRKAMGG